jgi:hypothetical protein
VNGKSTSSATQRNKKASPVVQSMIDLIASIIQILPTPLLQALFLYNSIVVVVLAVKDLVVAVTNQ